MTHPLEDKVQPFLLSLKQERRLQSSTIELYRTELRELLRLLHNPSEIHGLKSYLGMKAPGTHQRKIVMWKTFLATCETPWRECLDCLQSPRIQAKVPRYFTEAEKAALYGACQDSREKILITLGLRLGLRRNELVQLRYEHIEGDYLRVHRKGAKEQMLPINNELKQLIENFRLQENRNLKDYILRPSNGRKFSPGGLAFLFKEISARAGLKASLHAMRHTFATSLVNRGADLYAIMELMGHSSIRITEKYMHNSPAHLRNALELLTN